MKRRLNTKAIIVGILSLIGFFFSFSLSYKDMNIRNHGKVLKTPITEIRTRSWKTWVGVTIDGKNLNAGSISMSKEPKIDDSIEVCYIPGEYCVVQTSMNPRRYYLFFFTESLLFIAGIYLIIGGLIGVGLEKLPKNQVMNDMINNIRKERKIRHKNAGYPSFATRGKLFIVYNDKKPKLRF